MKTIKIFELTGSFAENKDVAKDIRIKKILPALKKKEKVIIDFSGIDGVTQSFIHALISELIRSNGAEVLDKIYFKNCSLTVQKIINIVVEYLQEA